MHNYLCRCTSRAYARARSPSCCSPCTQYPNHYVSHKLKPSETITVDGKLDEPAWLAAETMQNMMVDITRHSNQMLNAIPEDLQADIKVRWDDDYFYVGATLRESYVTAKNVGHNNHAPYSPDNDFEIFIDVSGTTQYYLEFEMSMQNSTYDIKVPCQHRSKSPP